MTIGSSRRIFPLSLFLSVLSMRLVYPVYLFFPSLIVSLPAIAEFLVKIGI